MKNFIKFVLSLILLLFTEEYFFKIMKYLHIDLSGVNTLLVSTIIYIILFAMIFIIYKGEIKSAFNRYNNHFGENILYTIISFVVLFIVMMILNYLCKIVGKSFHITYHELGFINIFNKKLSVNLILQIIRDIILKPFIKVTVFVLGVNEFTGGKEGTIISGLLYGIYMGYLMGGSISFIIVNVIPIVIMMMILSFINNKHGNIAYSIITLMLYELFSAILIGKFL